MFYAMEESEAANSISDQLSSSNMHSAIAMYAIVTHNGQGQRQKILNRNCMERLLFRDTSQVKLLRVPNKLG
jgi:hypothetical protein